MLFVYVILLIIYVVTNNCTVKTLYIIHFCWVLGDKESSILRGVDPLIAKNSITMSHGTAGVSNNCLQYQSSLERGR